MTIIAKYLYAKPFLILFLLILLILKYSLDTIPKKNLNPIYNKIEEYQKSTEKSFFSTFFIESDISMIKEFRKNNVNDVLINKDDLMNFKSNKNPEVSVIITVYNQADCFYKGLRSVQNQSLKNIEIIIVDDCSTDNSAYKTEKYQKEDNRIIFLKHMINYGTMKSRADAIKLAKGKYITIIDGDDALATKNILLNSLNIANIGNLDIVEFKFISFYKTRVIREKNNVDRIKNIYGRIIYQPELKSKFIKLDKLPCVINRNIWQKLIKNDIFKKVLEYIGPKYTEDFILVFEDTIMAVSLFIISKSYYLMKDIGYYRTRGECSKCELNDKTCILDYTKKFYDSIQLDFMKYIQFLSEKLRNNRFNCQVIYNELFAIIHDNFERTINIDIRYINNTLDYILKKFTFYSKYQKDRIINLKYKLSYLNSS